MPTQKGKITVRQALIIFMLSTFSPMIRVFPADCSKFAKGASWISPIISMIVLVVLFYVLNAFFKNTAVKSLSDVFNNSLGKVAGRILLVFYLLWLIILYFLYIRYYAERLLSSIFPDTDIRFFLIVMMALVFMACRGGIETYARFSEISFLVLTAVLTAFFIFLIPNVKISNILPITYHDTLPVLEAVYPVLGIWGYITLMTFIGEDIINMNQIKVYTKKVTIFLGAICTLMLIFVIGSLGDTSVEGMTIPFFSAIKLISFMHTFDRFESMLLAIWVLSDFLVITFFAIVIKHIIKSLFAISETKFFAAPIALLGYAGGLYMASNMFELRLFTSTIGLIGNTTVCFIIPVIVLAVGKIREKIASVAQTE